MSDGVGLWVDFNPSDWLYIPKALPEGYKSARKWCWDTAVELSRDLKLSDEDAMNLCKYIEHIIDFNADNESKFVLLKDLSSSLFSISLTFDVNSDADINDVFANRPEDEMVIPFEAKNIGSGIKSLTRHERKKMLRDNIINYELKYTFVTPEMIIIATVINEDRNSIEEHDEEFDEFVHNIIPVV